MDDHDNGCRHTLRIPEDVMVVSFSDSLVSRLPVEGKEETPIKKEQRARNTDDFWRDRLNCLERNFMKRLGATEESFTDREERITNLVSASKLNPLKVQQLSVTTCYTKNVENPYKCNDPVTKYDEIVDKKMTFAVVKRNKLQELKKPKK